MQYYKLSKKLTENYLLPVDVNPFSKVTDYNVPWFISCYTYNTEHKKQFDETGSLKGITDNTTSKIWWDFDSDDLEASLKDAQTLYNRLEQLGAKEEHIAVAFSGSKGFSVVLKTNQIFIRSQVLEIARKQAGDLATWDSKIYDNQRVFRLPLTKHEGSGLFKTPLSEKQFFELNTYQIKELAKDPSGQGVYINKRIFQFPSNQVPLPLVESIIPQSVEITGINYNDVDWSKKPKGWKNCKWSIQQGNFEAKERHTALTVLAATCAGMGYDKETTYHLCKAAIKKQAKKTGTEEFDKDELWENIIEQSIFSNGWNGGQYSCKSDAWLGSYCKRLGHHACKHTENVTVGTKDMHVMMDEFVRNYDQNILYSGIGALDKKIKMMIGTSNGIVGAPGSGKTSAALQIINHNSKKGIPCVFFSYDMFFSAVYSKILQKHTDLTEDEIFDVLKSGSSKKKVLQDVLDREYANVEFCFKSGQSAEEIRETIREVENKVGKKVKLVVIDYNELIMSDLSDMTASSSQTAQRIRQVAHDEQICSITLMQPTKEYFDPSQEIHFLGAVKGSGAVTQAATWILGIARPGFDPFNPEKDKFYNITCLKNRNGALFSLDFSWNGKKGEIGHLTDSQRDELKHIREERDKKLEEESW
jgi:KaiC/GvpD/RAD55 family RecA-like ATPase